MKGIGRELFHALFAVLLAIVFQYPKRMLSTEEAAAFLGMTVDGLRGLTYKRLIPYYKPNGKNMYFDVDELVSWQKKNHFEPAYSASEN